MGTPVPGRPRPAAPAIDLDREYINQQHEYRDDRRTKFSISVKMM
jgi:hypothetical protein